MVTVPLIKEVDDLYDQPANLLRRANQISTSLFHDELGKKITPVQYMVLRVVASSPGIDQVALAGRAAIDTSTAANVAVRLEAKGLITRDIQPGNRRQRALFLTHEGRVLLENCAKGLARMHRRLFEGFSQQETHNFLALLHKLVDINNALSRSPLRQIKTTQE